jgi:NAD(P)-dependent dehydrogenase (short-subunit alcohol dehydrogenase family)
MRLHDKVAIVTGGGHGIGRAIVRRFAQEGAKVVIADWNASTGAATQGEVEATGGAVCFVQTNVAQRSDVDRMVAATLDRFGRIDILVNNAALWGENGPFLEVAEDVWDRVIAVNQKGVFLCAQAAAAQMAHTGGGSIINISSVNGLVPQPRCAAYAATKAAVESLTKTMAIDLAPFNIRANCIAPGPIQIHAPDDEPPRPYRLTLLRRTGLPAEIAAVAVFLASDESSFVTGERIGVDGGKLINGYAIYGLTYPGEDA